MGLRGRFTLWFGGAALLPIAATAAITWYVVSNRYNGEFQRTIQGADTDARRERSILEEHVTRAVNELAVKDNPLIRGLLNELAKRSELSSQLRFELKQFSPVLMRAVGLDTLTLAAGDGKVLASPHQEGRIDGRDARVAKIRPGVTAVAWEKVMRRGGVSQILVMQAARTVADRGQELTLIGAKEIGADLVARLHRDGVVEARLTDAQGKVLYTTEDDWSRLAHMPSVQVPLSDADGVPVARLEVAVPDDNLRRALRDVAVAIAALGSAALLLALLLGFLVSRRMTRDLDALVEGAQAVSRGDLGHQVQVRRRDEVGELAAAFNAMTAELEESKERLLHAERVAAWQDIARSLAHEIKNPLTPIQMGVETMRKAWRAKHRSFDEIFEESTHTVLEEVQRLKKIVSEFAQFARMPAPHRQACDLNDLVGGALALYSGAVRVVKELGGTLPPLDADRDQLTQVVLNLLENARDAVASRGSDQSVGRITVRTRQRGGAVELVVEDNGPGFDPSIQSKIFSPYFTTKDKGTGLGLAIVQRIVTEHGGRVYATSEQGKGARFIVELPAAAE